MPDTKRFLLRLDPRLFEAIRGWAADDLRSINAQIEYLLTDQARRAGRLPHRRSRPHSPEPLEPPEPEEETGSDDRQSSPAPAGVARKDV